jgi:opine dehydrogenase
MLDRPIAILGGGNAGHSQAADLTLGGFDVNFYEHPQFAGNFKPTLETQEIGIVEIQGQPGRTGKAKLHKVTTDMREALEDVKLIFVVIPSFAHDTFFEAMIPELKDGQVVVLEAANSGALRFRKLLREKAPGRDVTVYETNQPVCAARLLSKSKEGRRQEGYYEAATGVRAGAPQLMIFRSAHGPWIGQPETFYMDYPLVYSALPATDSNVMAKEWKQLYPLYRPARNVINVALVTPHHLIHPPLVILNTGRIEAIEEDFIILKDGHTPSVLRVQDAICKELDQIVDAVGGDVYLPNSVPRSFVRYKTDFPSIYGKDGLKNRFVTEDVPYGSVPVSEFGRKFGVPTPLVDAFIDIASAINGVDYRSTGRNLESLGLAGLSGDAILKVVNDENLYAELK